MEPVSFLASDNEGETNIEFAIAFELQNKARKNKNRHPDAPKTDGL